MVSMMTMMLMTMAMKRYSYKLNDDDSDENTTGIITDIQGASKYNKVNLG